MSKGDEPIASPWGPLGPGDRSLRLFPDEGGDWLIWSHEGLGSTPDEWPISEDLVTALLAWGRAWASFTPGRHYLYPEDDPDFDLAGHNATGDLLAARLQAELGPAWAVTHVRLRPGPAILQRPRLRLPRPFGTPSRRVELLSNPLGQPKDPARFRADVPPETGLRDGSLLLTLSPVFERGFCYAIQALWRGRQALPADLLRSWAVKRTDGPDRIYVPAREDMFATFASAIRDEKPSQWVSRHEDVFLTVLPAAWSPYRQQYIDIESREVKTSDPPDDGLEVNILFRTQHETRFAPSKSGIALRLAVTPAALNRFMLAFAREHDELRLRDAAASEEAGHFVPARYVWPPAEVARGR